jgi:putative transposase
VYNWALRLRTDSYRGGKTINYNASSAALTELKRQEDHAWLTEISCVPPQQALRHLQTAFRNFFEKRSCYPSFKKKNGPQAAEYTRSGFKWDPENRNLHISGIGRLRVRWSRDFESYPTTATITKDQVGRYFVTLVLDEKRFKMPKTKQAVGIDLGINRLATLSNGERIPNPRHLAKRTEKLARAQRTLSRRVRGSGRWKRARLRMAKIHAEISDARLDYMHKVTTDLVRRFDTICIEDLNVRGMVKNHALARAISDASFGSFGTLLAYKCDWYDKTLKEVDRFFPSSKRCSECGYVLERLSLSVREWDCPECSTHHDRDENAAKNILAAGHAVTARGGSVRPVRASARKGTIRRSANQPAVGRA